MSRMLFSLVTLAIAASPALAETMTMKIDGKDWAATVVNSASLPMPGGPVITMTGKMEGEKTSALSLQLAPASDDLKGHYELKSGVPKKGNGGGNFNLDLLGGDPMADSLRFQSGTLDVTAYDAAAHTLSGTFSGIVVSHDGAKKMTIENGVLDSIAVGP